MVARRAHNPEVVGSNPAPATKNIQTLSVDAGSVFLMCSFVCGDWGGNVAMSYEIFKILFSYDIAAASCEKILKEI